jgi:hypothetical protein
MSRRMHRDLVQIVSRTIYAYASPGALEAEEIDNSAECDSHEIGQRVTHFAAAPGIGMITYEVALIDDKGVWGRVLKNTIRIASPWEII